MLGKLSHATSKFFYSLSYHKVNRDTTVFFTCRQENAPRIVRGAYPPLPCAGVLCRLWAGSFPSRRSAMPPPVEDSFASRKRHPLAGRRKKPIICPFLFAYLKISGIILNKDNKLDIEKVWIKGDVFSCHR